ncbi:hypothetical protein C0993_005790 [Termitomyces sp. T159_Od127]|nr:hypothetical protein C0993_005790 [Termitomyces sp. T159_Od127]
MQIVSRTRLFPTSPQKPTNASLSILDSRVLRYAPSAGIWIFKDAPSVEELSVSLKIALDSYPQWSGQLQWAPYDPSGDHTQRFQRLMLAYGTSDAPGVEFIIATSSCSTSSFAGKPVDGCTNAGVLPYHELIDGRTPLAFHDAVSYVGLPSLIIQITTLADDGVAIGLKFAHPLADAQTMLYFTKDWAAVSRAIRMQKPPPVLSPIFDPLLIDRAAAGDIDGLNPSPSILEATRELPLHRYDCWNSKLHCPPFLQSLTTIPPEVESTVNHFGQPIDWTTWDYTASVSYYLVEFSAGELHAMWEEANFFSRVSHLNALQAHIWNLIIRARKFVDGECYLDVLLGFRNRLNPPLPTSFLGSPLTTIKVTADTKDAAGLELGPMAASIRSALNAFDASTLPALLHELAFEVSPLRTWTAFFGSRNIIFTSWLHEELRMQDMDFGTGSPTHVEAVIPRIDGCVQVMDTNERGPQAKAWYENGATVCLNLKDDVMQSILSDPALRKYRR